MEKPGIPKGTRDFSPIEMARRNYIFDTIRSVFKKYGYEAIETPSMENLSTLMGKYGDEGDKLIFKILNSGDFLSKVSSEEMSSGAQKLSTKISEKALRYDLTVPFARYIVQHRNEISFPFKRYQIQPVWRADRPQKGRYREFYQCDVDVIGSNSLLNELELLQIIDDVFEILGLKVSIKLNNRKVLAGLSELIGAEDKLIAITTAIDKIDKIGIENVIAELTQSGINAKGIETIKPLLELKGSNEEKLDLLNSIFKESETGRKGLEELVSILNLLKNLNLASKVDIDLTLARGLNYYTGAIIEVKSEEDKIGSICGGGRYDNLTGIFGLKDVSGVGVSFGAERIYDVLLKLDRFPKEIITNTQVLFVNFGEKEINWCIPIAENLRKFGINTEIFPDSVKMKKQMSYANKKSIPYVIMVGENEIKENKVMLRNMISGDQILVDPVELSKHIAS